MKEKKMLKLLKSTAFMMSLALLVVLSAPSQAQIIDPNISHEQVAIFAEEAYIYGLQQAVFYETRYVYTQLETSSVYAGLNRLNWSREPITPSFSEVVTPNATTLYGAGFFELSDEPLVVEIPAIQDRYYSFQTMDQYGDYFFYAGNQFTGSGVQKYILVGPQWKGKIPDEFKGLEIIETPSSTGFMIVRMALKSYKEEEIQTINQYQDALITTPLSQWLANGHKGLPYAERPKIKGSYRTFPRMAELTQALVENQTAMDYFQLLSLSLNDPGMNKRKDSLKEVQTLEFLAKIGVAEGLIFNPGEVSDPQKVALKEGFNAGKQKVKAAIRNGMITMNGWMLSKNMGNYGTDYLSRAAVADAGWGGPEAKSHTGAFCFMDENGQQLNGKFKYTLTFGIENLPPVTEFWSIPIYDITGYFVDNEIDRYTVNSFMYKRDEFYVGPNGKLTFYIQNEKPTDPNQQKNWLPAPVDEFRFAARFYGPYAPLIDGNYDMPRPVRVK